MSDITIWGLLFMIFLPIGQLWARINWLNGSLDQVWLLLPFFWLFPFSLVPAFMIYFKKVKLGTSTEPPYDYFMLIPIVSKIVISFFGSWLVEEYGFIASMFILLIQLALTATPHIIRTYKDCKNGKIGGINYLKAFLDGTIENGISDVFPIILGFLPFVGLLVNILESLPIIGNISNDIIWSIGYISCYVIINMINGIDINTLLCNIKTISIRDIITSVICLLASLYVSYNQ